MRKHIDRLVLRLANIGMDIENLQFFHSPSRNTIKRAKQTLAALGALKNGAVTDLGRKMERFPVESSYSRMVVEGMQYAPAVQSNLATIIALQEVGGIVKSGPRHVGWQRYTRQTRSDLLAQYDVLLAVPGIPEAEYEELGIIGKNIDKAMEIHERLHHDLGLGDSQPLPIAQGDEDALLKCITAGQLHQIWMLEEGGKALHITTRQEREISSTTVAKNASLFTGTPFDLEVVTPNGLDTLHLVNNVTVVDPMWLTELAPSMYAARAGAIEFDARLGTLVRPIQLTINGKALQIRGIPVLERTPENQRLFSELYNDYVEQRLEEERRQLAKSNNRHIPRVPAQRIRESVQRIARGVISTIELSRQDRTELYRLARLETWLGKDFVQSLNPPEQDRQSSQGGRHHAHRHHWKPKYKRHRD
jgi:HrpA-like RNA helicase